MKRRIDQIKELNKALGLITKANKIIDKNIPKEAIRLRMIFAEYMIIFMKLISFCMLATLQARDNDLFDEMMQNNFGDKK